ncbi:MAG TPA: hypothetical protein VG326_18680 [Tepidisphaeraceae bacterium]|jgi:hypothetical protein|nr:hypothetical protein [Tepidisphaeraceae bacterium]
MTNDRISAAAGWLVLIGACFCFSSATLAAEAAYRTDGDTNEKVPWFKLKPGEFPPAGSAHAIAGELIAVDHVNRTGAIRLDRTDAIRRGEWDHSLSFTLLPYGSLSYRNAPAELKDIPLGTHLHGEFYAGDAVGKGPQSPFNRAIRLEDDCSYFAARHRAWRIDAIDIDKGTLAVTGTGPGVNQVDAKPTVFQIAPATMVWKGSGIAASSDLAPGQSVALNATVCTLKGPGRLTDVWIDARSRELAAAHQLEVHRQFEHEHGLPGWIDDVDNQNGIVTMTIFAGCDRKLFEDFPANGSISAAVSEESLRTYDQGNDRMGGGILEVLAVPVGPGNSGVQIKFKPSTLLEGFRPKKIIRIFSGKWKKIDDLPLEERLYQ